ncbi:MAG: type I secretion system permease/ATPase, partial [Shimia sp.]
MALWLARAQGLRVTGAALAASLPAGTQDMRRVLAAAGLRAGRGPNRLRDLRETDLPALALGRDGAATILVARRGAAWEVREGPDLTVAHLDRAALRARRFRQIVLVRPDVDLAATRIAPEIGAPPGRHWFLGPLRAEGGAWGQLALAAFLVNLMGLALPLFVMNVYDRVIPTLAFATLWALALGVALALILEFGLRLLRARILEGVTRSVDLTVSSRLFAQALAMRLGARQGGAAVLATHIREFESVRDVFTSGTFVAAVDLLFIGLFLALMWWIVGP